MSYRNLFLLGLVATVGIAVYMVGGDWRACPINVVTRLDLNPMMYGPYTLDRLVDPSTAPAGWPTEAEVAHYLNRCLPTDMVFPIAYGLAAYCGLTLLTRASTSSSFWRTLLPLSILAIVGLDYAENVLNYLVLSGEAGSSGLATYSGIFTTIKWAIAALATLVGTIFVIKLPFARASAA